jgi:hypothetical protein
VWWNYVFCVPARARWDTALISSLRVSYCFIRTTKVDHANKTAASISFIKVTINGDNHYGLNNNKID